MRALSLIYRHRVPGFKETQIGFDPIQKRNPNQKESQNAFVSRPTGRPTHVTVDRALTESSLLSVGRPGGRLLLATVDRANPVHVVHTGRPAFSTNRAGGRLGAYPGLLQCAVLLLCLPISVLPSSISSISSLPIEAVDFGVLGPLGISLHNIFPSA